MEKYIEQYLISRTRELGGIALKLAPFWFKGIPDRLLLIPHGIAIFVEVKQKSGRLSDRQKRVIGWLNEHGFSVEVVWDREDVNKLFEKVLL